MEKMAGYLGDKYIFSLKPNPAAVGGARDGLKSRPRRAPRETWKKPAAACVEIIMKDNHTLAHRPENAVTWCRIAKEEAERVERHSTASKDECTMKLGIDSYTTRNSGLDAGGRARLGRRAGARRRALRADAVRVVRATIIWPTIRRTAEEKGLYIEFGMGSIVHWHPMAEKGRRLLAEAGYDAAVSDAQIVDPAPRTWPGSSARPSCAAWRAICSPATKATTWWRWPTRRSISSAEACPAAEELGMKIAMETHADFTVRELVSILARVDSPAFGLTVDCANMAFDLDIPQRLAGDPGAVRPDDPLQELPRRPQPRRAGPGELRLGRRRDRHRGHRRDCWPGATRRST